MKDTPLSSQQLAFLIFLLLPGSSLVFLTGQAAAQDAWIATFLGLGIGLYVLYAILKLHSHLSRAENYPNQYCSTGKDPRNFTQHLILWSIFIILVTFLFDINMVLQIIYPLVASIGFYTLLVLTCSYCLYKGLNYSGSSG